MTVVGVGVGVESPFVASFRCLAGGGAIELRSLAGAELEGSSVTAYSCSDGCLLVLQSPWPRFLSFSAPLGYIIYIHEIQWEIWKIPGKFLWDLTGPIIINLEL